MMQTPRKKILIVCIGNDLVADDAVGCHVYAALNASALPENVTTLYLAVGGITLLDRLDGSERAIIVVDAVSFGDAPGTVSVTRWDALPLPANAPVSIHGIGLREVFEIAPVLYPGLLTGQIFFVGIEGAEYTQCGASLSPAVADAVETACRIIMETAASLEEEIRH